MIAPSIIATALFALSSFAQAASPLCSGRTLVPGNSFDRVIAIFFENEDASTVIADTNFKNAAQKGIYHSSYYAVTHPSQPNYIAYVSGSTQGCTNDQNININAKSVADTLEAKGISWGAYAEGLPSTACYTGATYGTSSYARKHEPFISFLNVQNSSRCSNIKQSSQFSTDFNNGNLPQFTLYIPDLKNDGHDTSTSYAGNWLNGWLNTYLSGIQQSNTLLHLVFDESASTSPNKVYSVLLGGAVPSVNVGATDSTSYSHYSMLKTVENNWGLASLTSNDANATPFAGLSPKQSRCA
ncbi:hypothetical protein OC846_005810 [Tilletia horrida]|uniref:Acid phosphatase n=1 Tax=Tilletia horrida TaxID=155126 RepID=A0AAN6GL19_9BASI|nr:hypothetical protein OC845_005904 [Tilletia horrida]KAK0545072.1 hypothetical protein OC846_005810 [Tilletia horrida]KAK0561168.1 hypothetical protein OC861_005952 [Tilletia horrida]